MKWIVVTLISVIIILLILIYPYNMLSPGELLVGHLDIKNNCLSCHQPFAGIESSKCVSCHKISEIGKDSLKNDSNPIKGNALFHQNLKEQNCVSCHSDHNGLNPKSSINNFSHDFLLDSEKNNCNNCHLKPIDNRHKNIITQCNSCHNLKGWDNSVVFNHNTLADSLKNNCLSCHETSTFSSHSSFDDNCISCHSTIKWKPSTFDHRNYFVFDNNHPETCNTCHTTDNYKIYTCYNCHEHSVNKIQKEHRGISNFENCVRCHKSGNEDDIEMNDYKESNDIDNNEHDHKKEEDDD